MLRMLCQNPLSRSTYYVGMLFQKHFNAMSNASTSSKFGFSTFQKSFQQQPSSTSLIGAVTYWNRRHHLQQRNNNTTKIIITAASMIQQYHTSSIQLFGLEEFRDTIPRQQREIEPVGRSWSAIELRRKSYDDLHKLWYVLYKERNMLLTEQQLSRRKGLSFPQPDRIVKVRKSMGAIKHVLGERKREHLLRVKAMATEKRILADANHDEPLPQSA